MFKQKGSASIYCFCVDVRLITCPCKSAYALQNFIFLMLRCCSPLHAQSKLEQLNIHLLKAEAPAPMLKLITPSQTQAPCMQNPTYLLLHLAAHKAEHCRRLPTAPFRVAAPPATFWLRPRVALCPRGGSRGGRGGTASSAGWEGGQGGGGRRHGRERDAVLHCEPRLFALPLGGPALNLRGQWAAHTLAWATKCK